MSAYLKFALAIALYIAGYAAGHHAAYQAGALKLAEVTQANADQAQHAAELTAQAEAAARKSEQDMAAKFADVDSKHQKDMADAKANSDRIIADLRTGTVRLRAEWSCTPALASAAAQAAAGPGQPDAAADLRQTGAGHLIGIGDRCDADISALQEFLRKERGG
ncbi:lysis system i-spanin subunit Rz [Dyella caseinilytica]|uniref:Lysis protein n=1 Tax=Dyella caseinilytica TaxID=1849581 RepID=A0ABX7GPS6_9GAMM|nr:lysis system i-spanin subunit Rz [Dyella caseinilytica]QRN52403.1 lysis protein [Dyella caseinilytica]GGA05694.1 hypothetical protein GCM10011408_28270 [Dyella caseinilytica]